MKKVAALALAGFMLAAMLALSGCANRGAVLRPASGSDSLGIGWLRVKPTTLPDLAGAGQVLVKALKEPLRGSINRPVLVNFWAGWCGPCVTELPLLQSAEAAGTLDVVGISRDVLRTSADQELRRAKITYPNWMDPEGQYMGRFGRLVPVQAIPSSVLVLNGKIVATHVGPFHDAKDLQNFRLYLDD